MNLNSLKIAVFQANISIFKEGLAPFTFGNVSGIDRERNIVVIKPSGVSYAELSAENMVCVSLTTGSVIDRKLRPSSDTPTHLELYRYSPGCGGIVHTHSEFATAFAQAGHPIHFGGTTHADYFYGDIPVTRSLTKDEIIHDYEQNTGTVIIETIEKMDAASIPAVLVANHGPFVWGKTPGDALSNAMLLEYIAKLEYHSKVINPLKKKPSQSLLDKHYLRKHGSGAYYGQ